MSHVVSVRAQLKDLDILDAACRRLGWQLVRGQQHFNWYGRWVDDSPIPEHLFTAQQLEELQAMSRAQRRTALTLLFAQCDHAIKIPSAAYEIGLTRHQGGWQPLWDSYSFGGLQHLDAANGVGGLLQAYAAEAAIAQAKQLGRTWTEQRQQDGTLILTVKERGWR